jgi:hypothetical protein
MTLLKGSGAEVGPALKTSGLRLMRGNSLEGMI